MALFRPSAMGGRFSENKMGVVIFFISMIILATVFAEFDRFMDWLEELGHED